MVNVFDDFRRQFNGGILHQIDEAVVTTSDAVDLPLNTVEMYKCIGDFTHNVVQAGAKTAASNDGCIDVLRVEVQVSAGLQCKEKERREKNWK